MGEVNVYIHEPCRASLEVARKIRAWGTPKVRLWLSADDMEDCEVSVRRVIEQWRDGKIVDWNIQIDNSVKYYEWNLSAVQVDTITSNGLKALVQRCLTQNIQFVVLGDSTKCKGRMACFVDAPQRTNLPDSWQKFRWLTSYDEVLQFCQEQGVFDFDLRNTSRFSKIGKIEQGAPVYKELSTGYFIYFDNLHKTHYEVFSSTGRHWGEMSLNGTLDRLTADPNKHLSL